MYVLCDASSASQFFKRSIEADRDFLYSYRQLARCYLHFDLVRAGEVAREAVERCERDDLRTILECAEILSFCSKNGLREAKKYLTELKGIMPSNLRVKREFEKYEKAVDIWSVFEADEMPGAVSEILLVPWFVLSQQQASKEIKLQIQSGLSSSDEELPDEEAIFQNFAPNLRSDQYVRSAVLSAVARTKYNLWYRHGFATEVPAVLALFRKALGYNERNIVARSYLGTALKELEGKFEEAEQEYRTAVQGRNFSGASYLSQAIALNNLGKHIIDMYGIRRKTQKDLTEAYTYLKEATKLEEDHSLGFAWPKINLEYAQRLLGSAGHNTESKKT